ncbi:MAG: hypothetical protein WCL32_21685 [Planctomycetota bacterium]
MAKAEHNRKVTLTFGGNAFAHGRVPLTLLADKLKALQSLLFHAAATVEHDTVARRGQWVNRYRDAVELRFADARPGSLVIEAELDEPEASLFDGRDVGIEAIDLAYEFARTVEGGDPKAVAAKVPDRQERLTLLRTLEQLAPRTNEAFDLTFGNGSINHPGIRLSAQTRAHTQSLISREMIDDASDLEEARIVGTLTKIHYDVAPQKLSVRVRKGQEIDCYYDESLREQVSNLCAGSIVEVVGWATLARNGRLKQLDIVTGVEAVSMEPIRISRFEHGGRVHQLREAVSFNIEFAEGVWAYSNDALGIRGYAFKRDDALRELNEAFDFAYRDIGLADENSLIGKAIDMRREFQRLVQADGGD